MNVLTVGFDKRQILEYVPDRNFLIIDDGALIDALDFPPRRSVVRFDVAMHSFNPLKDMDYRRAREFIAVLDAVFPEGENTLTRRNANFQLLCALLDKPRRLERLITRSKETEDAWQKVQTLLLSPVLERVLNHPTNFSLKGTVLARLNRAELGDFDCFVLANLLISQFQGAIVIPDFGFYAASFHTRLIRQERLIAGVNSLDEVPKMKSQLLLMETKVARQCTPEDAKVLALYKGLVPNTIGHTDFVERSIRPAA